ncbi:outer membrane protein assembly factor BamB family protein [Aeromicrobium wangtongii]|uniref:PQQ-like beta-propeller repeat protein n=1 Tax=Aeromicrobium wangtongii TaxID=2969247 RepID=A0ABY5MA95_9ACTN|nr:PQQ-binding-like beta-propeller repeat protein [Aeromicrobium wangtongii]MCD9197568.1 PQQ-like beta-propeller repeat protein [Aeromicrobium wangtongii]UUP15060.1 PQQ-like beta-propeller repeat protein [Aeromicrobium wangtongii]
MRRLAAVAVTMVLALTACTGSGGSDGEDEQKKGPSLPLPDRAPSARGPATGPALDPKVLLAASDDLEELAGTLDTAQVERRSGAFITGRTVVGYSVDNISGYDLGSGDLLWTAELDLGGGTVCFVSRPDRAVKTFTVAYGDGGYCPELATIRVSDGTVLKVSDKLTTGAEFEGESLGGTVNHLFTVGGKDHLVDQRGGVWKMVKGEPEPVARLQGDSYYDLHPTPEGDVLIGARGSDRGRCRVDGYALPSFKPLWTQESKTLFPEVREDCVVSAAPGNPAWLVQETSDRYYMAQVDPMTGTLVGQDNRPKMGDKVAEGQFELASAANQFDQALGLPGGDTVFAQVRGLTRYSLKDQKIVWDLDLSQLELESDDEFALTTVLPQGVTADGHLVATVSNETAVEIVAIEVDTGKLVARWAVPPEYRNGFQVEPGMTLFGDGLVLTRNFEEWEFTFGPAHRRQAPDGDRYDIGVFTFPEPDNSPASAVPTAGPVDTEVEALGGVQTPADAAASRDPEAFTTGKQVIASSNQQVTGFDAASGKSLWTLDLGDGGASRVCAGSEPDRAVKTFTVAVATGGPKAPCNTLVRVQSSNGTVLDRVTLPIGKIVDLFVHEAVVYVVTDDLAVSRLVDGALVPHGRLQRQPYAGLERAKGDPALAIGMTSLKGGRDWSIDAYRLPSFEPVWSTRASKVLGAVDRKNGIDLWHGNALWVSGSVGDASVQGKTVKDTMSLLDPATGQVVVSTGPVKRDYLADDLAQMSLTGAITGAYDSVGFDNGDMMLPQRSGIMRYSLAEQKIRWSLDTKSIMDSMERDRKGSFTNQEIDLLDGGKTVLVTFSNYVSVEAMTVDASTGKITGRWNVPKASRNGLQASPKTVPFPGGFALVHSEYSWDYGFAQSDRAVPPEQRYDVGLFALPKAKGKAKGKD